MAISGDRNVLRGLAAQVREIAELPGQAGRAKALIRHNSLKSERPLVFCFPEGAWEELLPPSELKCTDPAMREWERSLRMKIISWTQIRDDNIVEPFFDINWEIDPGHYGVEIPKRQGDGRGSYKWTPPIRDFRRDMAKLKYRVPSVDRKATESRLASAREIFDGILDVRVRGTFWWTMGLTQAAIFLAGLEEFFLMTHEAPEDLHRLMSWLRDEHLKYIEWFEKEGLLSLNNEGDYVGSGGIGYTSELPSSPPAPGESVRLIDLWGLAESQETAGVSPSMFAEFVLQYQMPLLQRFGLVCYGCCEALDTRIEHVLKIPRLRRISVSPWSDQRLMAEKLQDRFIFSRKPNPALICASFDEDEIRKDLRKTLEIAGEGNLEIIMKDTHTVQRQPWRISRWVEIAREEISSYMGD